MTVRHATDPQAWETFVTAQRYASFLQSWTMGEVYRDIGQEQIRLVAEDPSTGSGQATIAGACQAIVVPARRGKHLMVQYGPLVRDETTMLALLDALKDEARSRGCSFIRISPFWLEKDPLATHLRTHGAVDSPMHLLSEYTWYIPLKETNRWAGSEPCAAKRSPEHILAGMRKTTRNLVGRAEREGVTVEASTNPLEDLEAYFALQEETRKRHHFVPYRASYIRSQVKRFAPLGQSIVYIAKYQGEVVAASVHMSYAGVTSYHHGASTHKHAKIPASYLLQWTAIRNALERGDDIYNFWGIAPRHVLDDGKEVIIDPKHPFAGVTTFKTGFGGNPLPLTHCTDIPLTAGYRLTRAFETLRKWKRGF
jgi:peptidoglycan pentaglycine glycine transferase (the first glycine)